MFKPMLAKNTEIEDLRLPVYVSPKLEGVRAVFTPDGLKTRPMKKFGNPWVEYKFKTLSDFCQTHGVYVEGELYCHKMEFGEISSRTRRRHHPETDDLVLFVFDYWDPKFNDQKFEHRILAMSNAVRMCGHSDIRLAEQFLFEKHVDIVKYYVDIIGAGFEGLVFKDPKGTYKHGRSTNREQKFLRIKPETTYDGIVLEIVERMENLVPSEVNELGYLSKKQDKDMKAHTGMAAVAVVQCNDFDEPIRVTLSRGLSDMDRAEIWSNRDSYIGKHLRFVGLPVPGMLPRAPRFDAWRTDLD